MMYIINISFLLFAAIVWPQQKNSGMSGYSLRSPSSIIILPEVLNEISGIACIDSTTFACIQDELGIVFIYNSRTGRITDNIVFSGNGDYEAVAMAGNSVYILRSDGVLYRIDDYSSKTPSVKVYETGIPARNSEGLCYDAPHKRLLIACKEGYTDDDVRNRQLIYSFNPVTGRLSDRPVFEIDVKKVREMIKLNKIKLPGIDEDETGKLDFRISDIGLNPRNGKLYILSSSDNALLVADKRGAIETVEPLSGELFRQAEGITFTPAGVLYISNEASGKKPTLLRFNPVRTATRDH